MEFKDYYRILGVDRRADPKAISQAFRRLARQYHPDVSKAKGAEERFKEINEAYQVLGDPQKRAQYDQIYDAYQSGVPLHDLFGRVGGARTWTGPGGGFTVTIGGEHLEDLFEGGLGGFSEFFKAFFGDLGGLGGFGRTTRQGRRAEPWHGPGEPWGRGTDAQGSGRAEATLTLTVEEALRGARRRVQLPDGRHVEVQVPAGVRSGQTIRLPGASGGQDVYLTVEIAPHPQFERNGDDLTVEVPIGLVEAVLGGDVEVPTPEGTITVTVPPGTQPGQRLRLRGRGLPRGQGRRGDLYARVKVVVPTALSPRERELFEELRRLRREPSRTR
ncbi:MAG: DnaJ C-terminal domain-containing protein [Armatimonadota bacterium]|nr:DnaJ C-terminal domain-containing protein [Armatimonadota bacterium]MDR7536847.1 DnaJ C-terminal domain-containing protein [Armatimonadota bacterium]